MIFEKLKRTDVPNVVAREVDKMETTFWELRLGRGFGCLTQKRKAAEEVLERPNSIFTPEKSRGWLRQFGNVASHDRTNCLNILRRAGRSNPDQPLCFTTLLWKANEPANNTKQFVASILNFESTKQAE